LLTGARIESPSERCRRENRGAEGVRRGEGCEFLDFASQMATVGAFWALSFTVWMHVLHIKNSALDLKSAAKFTNRGV